MIFFLFILLDSDNNSSTHSRLAKLGRWSAELLDLWMKETWNIFKQQPLDYFKLALNI